MAKICGNMKRLFLFFCLFFKQFGQSNSWSKATWKQVFPDNRILFHLKSLKLTTGELSIPSQNVLSVQKVLSSSGRATRWWPMYFRIRRSLPARPEPDNTFWTASTKKANTTGAIEMEINLDLSSQWIWSSSPISSESLVFSLTTLH